MEKELFETALGIEKPLYIEKIKFDKEVGKLDIHINFERGGKFSCSGCECTNLPVHDTVPKTWRHLNFFQYDCYIHLRTPRTKCNECGDLLWTPPWSRKQSGFTMLFEAFIMTLAREMAVSKIAELIGEHDTKIWRVIKHHTDIAYAKKDLSGVTKVGCDETSSRKGHNYITVFADMESKEVIYATTGKNANTIKRFTEELPKHNASSEQVTEVTIDMSPAFISGTNEHLPNASITFDKFHVIQALNKVQDEVRRMEQKDNPILKKSRYVWLKNPDNLTEKQKEQLEDLTTSNLKTAKVYQMKLVFQDIYRNIKDPETAEIAIKKWLSWAVRSRIEPVKNFAKMVKNHFDGIMRYFTSRLTSGAMEGINSRIQNIKRRARGFRNMDNFISMIYLEMANLSFDLPT